MFLFVSDTASFGEKQNKKRLYTHGILFVFSLLKCFPDPNIMDFPGGSDGKASVYNVRDPGSIPGSGRSPGEGNGNLLQYYCLENPVDRGAW